MELRKTFVKSIDISSNEFLYLKEKFSKISDAKVKERIFVAPQKGEPIKDENKKSMHGHLSKKMWSEAFWVTTLPKTIKTYLKNS